MSSFLDRLKDKMAGVVRPITRLKDKTRYSVVTNRFDDRAWKQSRTVRPVDELINDLGKGDVHLKGTREPYDAAPELVHDLFMALYKANPRLEDPRNIHADCYPNHKIMSEVLGNEKLAELQEVTASDPAMSAIAMAAMGDVLRDILGRVPPPPPPPKPKPQGGGQGDEQQDGDQQQGEGQGSDGDEAENEPGGDQQSDADADEAAQEAAEREWQADFDKLLDELDLDRAVMKALDAAADETDALDALRREAGLEDGEWQSMSPEQRLAYAERLRTPEMRLLAQRVGRMRRFALGERATRVVNVKQEIYDVETGNDLKRVLPSQYALLATPGTTLEFYRRYTQRQLLQFAMHGEEEVGKGPVVICIDKSASMKGERMSWAMAVAEALRRFAADDERDYTALFFGQNRDRHRFEFPAGKGPFEKVLAFLSIKANGGTAFDGVLEEALKLASEAFDDESKPKADIVFVTDGEAGLADAWIERFNVERARVSVRVFAVYIGGAADMTGKVGPLALLQRISDVTIPVRDLKPESARTIFAQV